MRFSIELKHLLVEAFRPPAPEDVYEAALCNSCCVREGEEELARKNCPLVIVGAVYFYAGQPLLSIVASKDINFACANYGCKSTPGSIEGTYWPPLLVEDVISLTPSHPLVFTIIAAYYIHLAIQINTRVLLPSKGHRPFLLQSILLSGRVQVAMIGGSSSSDKDLSSREGAGGGIILYLAVVDGREGIAAS